MMYIQRHRSAAVALFMYQKEGGGAILAPLPLKFLRGYVSGTFSFIYRILFIFINNI